MEPTLAGNKLNIDKTISDLNKNYKKEILGINLFILYKVNIILNSKRLGKSLTLKLFD